MQCFCFVFWAVYDYFAIFSRYGLIHPKKDVAPKFVKLSAFDSDSDSDTKESTAKKVNVDISQIQKRQVARAHNAALTEDPTIFQYDELYDDIKNERESAKVVKKNEQQSVKYIGKLLESAERRKKEYERRIERQVQKERETEGEMYKDKEAFITSSYKQKLEEMKQAEEEEKRFDYLESIGDVTKQRDLGGFYRHLYEQKMGPKPTVATNSTMKIEEETATAQLDADNPTLEKRTTKEHVKKERVYRKRKSAIQDASDEDETTGIETIAAKKVHLQSNLDADSDFSIDSDSDEENVVATETVNVAQPTDVPSKNESKELAKMTEVAMEKDNAVTEEKNKELSGNETKADDVQTVDDLEVKTTNSPKIDKKKLWEKRTIGDVYVTAVQRYFERKLLREREG